MYAPVKTETVLATGSCRFPNDHSGIEEREGCVLQQAVMVVNQCGVQHIDGASGKILRAIIHAGQSPHLLSAVPVEGGKAEFLGDRKTRCLLMQGGMLEKGHGE